MKVRTISYQKVFPLASYVNEKVGIEIELDEHDDWNEAFEDAKELVNKWGTKLEYEFDPELNAPPQTIVLNGVMMPKTTIPPLTPVLDRNKDRVEIAIDNATTIEQLDLLMGDAAKYGLAKELNEKKRKLLNNERNKV